MSTRARLRYVEDRIYKRRFHRHALFPFGRREMSNSCAVHLETWATYTDDSMLSQATATSFKLLPATFARLFISLMQSMSKLSILASSAPILALRIELPGKHTQQAIVWNVKLV